MELLLCDEPAFSLYLIRTPTSLYVFARATFLEDTASSIQLLTSFTVTHFIYHLVISQINIGVFTLKLLSGAQSGCTSQIIFILNPMSKNCASNLLSQGNIEQEYLSKDLKKFQFLECLIKI